MASLLVSLLLLLGLCAPAVSDAGVYRVPKGIADDCSTPVEAKIMAWLARVPDGSTALFGAGRCYGQDGTITLTGRHRLVIDGKGSEFRALTPGGSQRANWRFVRGRDLTVQNMAVRGSNPDGLYEPALEWQHGYAVQGVQGMTLLNVRASDTWGDGVMLWRGSYSHSCGHDASSARNVVISGATFQHIGRQGVSVVDAERVTLQDSTIGPVAWSSVDIETDNDCEIARRVTVRRNVFGANRYGVIASVGFGAAPQVGGVTVTDNIQTAPTGLLGECWAPVRILSPAGVYRDKYRIRGNLFLARRNAFELRRLRDVDVSSNAVSFAPLAGCGSPAGLLLVDSGRVGIRGNHFGGADRAVVDR